MLLKTDDTLPFRTTLLGEYALLLAPTPLGLGFSEAAIQQIAETGFQCRFEKTADGIARHRI